MQYQWADGFHAPKEVAADDVAVALEKLKEPSPENLFEASKRKRHVLHDDLWAEGDQVWANRARMERCRKIIGSIVTVVVAGGKNIEVRAVEFVKTNGHGVWASIDDIRSSPDLLEGYLGEVQRLQEQAAAKMARVRELLKSDA